MKENSFYYQISTDTLINYIVNEFFYMDDEIVKKMVLEYFNGEKEYQEILESRELVILKNNLISLIKLNLISDIS